MRAGRVAIVASLLCLSRLADSWRLTPVARLPPGPRRPQSILRGTTTLSGSPPATKGQDSQLQAIAALNLATLIWGSQHAVIKDVVADVSPASICAVRFVVGALLVTPFLPGAPWRSAGASDEADAAPGGVADAATAGDGAVAATWASAGELGAWLFAGYALQAWGLQYTTASRSAFLLYLNVKLVPILALVLYGRRSSRLTWASAATAFCGTALLSFDGSPPNLGDAYSLAAACASAKFILTLEDATRTRRLDPSELNAATLSCCATLCLGWAALDPALADEAQRRAVGAALADNVPQIFYLSLVTTAVANWLQAFGQREVPSQEAAVLFSLDPVYGALFSWWLLGETLGPTGIAGIGLVLAAVAISRSAPIEEEEQATRRGRLAEAGAAGEDTPAKD